MVVQGPEGFCEALHLLSKHAGFICRLVALLRADKSLPKENGTELLVWKHNGSKGFAVTGLQTNENSYDYVLRLRKILQLAYCVQ